MAALRGTIRGDRVRSNTDAISHRLADRSLSVSADTWQTFARTDLARDGSGSFQIRRNGQTILRLTFSAETERTDPTIAVTFGNGETRTYHLFGNADIETGLNPNGAAPEYAEVTR